MAGASFFALLDDIAAILDDVAVMTKVAAKKTAGVLGDDLALNAQQVSGVNADRELPVVWAVAKGSFRNKLILVPAALLISAIMPWAITPLLMLGGMFLCFEGFEKIWHALIYTEQKHSSESAKSTEQGKSNIHRAENKRIDNIRTENKPSDEVTLEHERRQRLEQQKVKTAITTDFILSAEIIAIALGTVAASSLMVQFSVLASVAIVMTIGVYGLVALIVKLDDGGLYLTQMSGNGVLVQGLHKIGYATLAVAPFLMRGLTVIGTVAMFMVGGDIVVHGLPSVAEVISNLTAALTLMGSMGRFLTALLPVVFNALFGVFVGAIVCLIVGGFLRIKRMLSSSTQSK